MQLRYDEDLVESAVTLCTSGRRRGVPALQIMRFHREREKLYALLDPDERNAAFFKLHLDWFREWGLEKLLAEPLKEFPLLPGALNLLAFRQARGGNDEGAELYLNESGQRSGVVALRPERFACGDELAAFLRHELMHLHDMVDPVFGYAPELELAVAGLSQQRLARERYRLLWAIVIDGRLSRVNRVTVATREQRLAEFARAFAFWPAPKQQATFDSLWFSPAPTHRTLAVLVADPRDLLSSAKPQPGAPCPLCGFPTFDWANGDALVPEISQRIETEFPHWSTGQGLCARCLEAYEAAANFQLQPVVV